MTRSKINFFVALFFTLGSLISFFMYYHEETLHKKLTQEKFKTQIEKKSFEIRERLELNSHILNSLAAFHYGSKEGGKKTDLKHQDTIKFGSREWSIEAWASEYFMQTQEENHALVFLILLMFVTTLISYALYVTLTKQSVLMEANEEMRRFQNVAIGREERIVELKSIIKTLQERLGGKLE